MLDTGAEHVDAPHPERHGEDVRGLRAAPGATMMVHVHGTFHCSCDACGKEGPGSWREPGDASDAALDDGWVIVRAERPSLPSKWLCAECADRRKAGGYLHRIAGFSLPDGFTVTGLRS